MTIEINIHRSDDWPMIDDEYIQTIVKIAYLSTSETTEVSLKLIDYDESQTLNNQFRHKNNPTNVLAFPYSESFYLGDIAICIPLVEKEAKQQGKTFIQHFSHLLVHGVLHLQGYDHIHEDERLTMEAKEIQLLKLLNIPNPYEEEISK